MSIQLLTQFVNRRNDFVTIWDDSFDEAGKTPIMLILFSSSVQNDMMEASNGCNVTEGGESLGARVL